MPGSPIKELKGVGEIDAPPRGKTCDAIMGIIEEGQEVRRTGEILSVPVGDGFMGRVIDPLGTPIDGLGDIEAEERRGETLVVDAAFVDQQLASIARNAAFMG